MKKLLLIALAATLSTVCVKAQNSVQPEWLRPERVVYPSDTTTNADTNYVTIKSVGSNLKSIQATVTKVSGTVGGTVILQGTVDGIGWVNVNTDTLTLSDQATNSKVWLITSTSYNSYRVQYKTSGTQVSYLNLSYLRRPDEN